MKEKSSIYRSDVIEMFDRSKMVRFDMLDFAIRNQAEITIRVNEKGMSTLQIIEHTKDKIYLYELSQTDDSIKYQEIENKK